MWCAPPLVSAQNIDPNFETCFASVLIFPLSGVAMSVDVVNQGVAAVHGGGATLGNGQADPQTQKFSSASWPSVRANGVLHVAGGMRCGLLWETRPSNDSVGS